MPEKLQRITITISQEELAFVWKLARQELRTPPQQIRRIIQDRMNQTGHCIVPMPATASQEGEAVEKDDQ